MRTLADLRQATGKSQSEVAAVLGVTRLTIWRWENGKNPLPAWALLALAKVYKVRCDQIELPKREDAG